MDIDVETLHSLVVGVAQHAILLSVEQAQALVDEMNRMESLMPILDPTGYIKIRKTMPGHKALAVAFLTFRQAIEQLNTEST
jgi:hypothetical protein